MLTNDSFFAVCGAYFTDSAILPLFVIAAAWLMKKWNKEKKQAFLLTAVISVILLYNGIVCYLAGRIGEGETYYRFFWICPIVLIVSLFVVNFFFEIKGVQRFLIIAIAGVGVFLFSSKLPSTWTNLPKNIYQLNPDVIQVADIILELENRETATIVDDGSISNTVRQYTSKIGFTELNNEDVEYVLSGKNTNYIGRYLADFFSYNNSDYFLVQKSKPEVGRVVESIGLELVTESDHYDIYGMDSEQMNTDVDWLREIENRYGGKSNLEYIPIEGYENTFDIIYLTDFGTTGTEDDYRKIAEKMNTVQAGCVIINSQLSQNAGWYLEQAAVLEQLTVPYYCNNQEIQIIEQNGIYLCLIDNRNGISETVIKKMTELNAMDKPIVLVTSAEIKAADDLYEVITAEDSQVVQILTARRNEYYKAVFNDKIIQYAAPADNNTMFTVVRVKGK